MSLTVRCILALCLSLAPACGSLSPPELVPPERAIYPDAGPDADAGCGLSVEQAERAHPGERLCQTIEYRLNSGYCTHYVACSSLY